METQSEPLRSPDVIGRLAPSPTGALHLGNARSFLLAWLSARQQSGKVILRIEDIDSPRVKPWAIESTIDDLQWLGLDWDIGPENSAAGWPATGTDAFLQTQRMDRYREVLDELISRGAVYPCTCTRSEVAQAASAPHENGVKVLEGPIYPGTCRGRLGDASAAPRLPDGFAWRWAFGDGELRWRDCLRGPQHAYPARQLGDFVVARGSGLPAYQLAVVVDDYDQGVTEVIRGDDLIVSTYRQVEILRFLGWPEPHYYHVPLMVGPDGRRLAKRHGDTRLSYFRERGFCAEALVGYLAWTIGILPEPQAVSASGLVGQLQWTQLSRQPTVLDLESTVKQLHELS